MTSTGHHHLSPAHKNQTIVSRAAKSTPVALGTVCEKSCIQEVLKSNSKWSLQRLSQVAELLYAHKASLTCQSCCACVLRVQYDGSRWAALTLGGVLSLPGHATDLI